MTSQGLIDFSIGYSYKFTSFETLNFQIPYNPLHDSYSKVSLAILQFLTITENLDIHLNKKNRPILIKVGSYDYPSSLLLEMFTLIARKTAIVLITGFNGIQSKNCAEI